MTLYTLLHHVNNGTIDGADVTLFTSLEEAKDFMELCYWGVLTSLDFNTNEQTIGHECELNLTDARIDDDGDIYSWEIEEHEVDISTTAKVRTK